MRSSKFGQCTHLLASRQKVHRSITSKKNPLENFTVVGTRWMWMEGKVYKRRHQPKERERLGFMTNTFSNGFNR